MVSQRDRQKVLVVVPAALRDSTWLPFLRRYDLVSSRVEVVTYDELRLGKHLTRGRMVKQQVAPLLHLGNLVLGSSRIGNPVAGLGAKAHKRLGILTISPGFMGLRKADGEAPPALLPYQAQAQMRLGRGENALPLAKYGGDHCAARLLRGWAGSSKYERKPRI